MPRDGITAEGREFLEHRRLRPAVAPPALVPAAPDGAADGSSTTEGKDGDADDSLFRFYGSPLIPAGYYTMAYLGAQKGRVRWEDREVIFAKFRVVEGEHAGDEVLRYYNRKKGRLSRSHELFKDFTRLTGRIPPTRGFKLGSLLGGRLVVGRVATVDSVVRRGKREPTPPELHYSKVAALISFVVGPLRPFEGKNVPSEEETST